MLPLTSRSFATPLASTGILAGLQLTGRWLAGWGRRVALPAAVALSLAACHNGDSTPAPVAPAIATQPADASVTEPATASFSVVATGDAPLSYQWQRNVASTWTNIAGATGSSYTTAATTHVADDAAQFRVNVTNAVGTTSSAVATLHVAAPPGVGPAGGTVTGPNGAQVIIPAGALSSYVLITVTQDATGAPTFPPGGVTPTSAVYAFLPHGTAFQKPVTIQVPFDPTQVPAGRTPTLYKAEQGGSFAPVAGATVSGNFVTASVSTFSWAGTGAGTPTASGMVYSAISGNCARQALSGMIDCWGSLQGLTNDPALLNSNNNPPTTVANARAFGEFSMSTWLCGINGTDLWCYGGANPGPNGAIEAPPAGQSFVATSATYGNFCALTSVQANAGIETAGSRQLYCWGNNTRGEVGVGALGAVYVPTAVATNARYLIVKQNSMTSCATRTTGEVDCWGDDSYGQSGHGYIPGNAYRLAPIQVPGVLSTGNGFSLAVNTSTVCAITTTGTTMCWGDNSYGQIGDGTIGNGNTGNPNQIKGASTVAGGYVFVEIAAQHTGAGFCGRVATGEAYCWGNGTTNPPQVVGAGQQFKHLADGAFCGIGLADDKTYCWGATLVPVPLANQ